jgi:hypothetical protein
MHTLCPGLFCLHPLHLVDPRAEGEQTEDIITAECGILFSPLHMSFREDLLREPCCVPMGLRFNFTVNRCKSPSRRHYIVEDGRSFSSINCCTSAESK